MSGWKTWVSVALTGAIATLQAVEAFGLIPSGLANTVTMVILPIAAMFGITGIGHKIEKGAR
jgi:hypothetical protein